MLLNRHVFQNFERNRLRWHQFVYSNQNKIRDACLNNGTFSFERQFIRTKSDIIIQNAQVQTHSHSAQIPNQNSLESKKTLPFEEIPCADPSNVGNISNLIADSMHKFKQLVTSKWDNRFHEEIDGYHCKFGPIFRKSLTPDINGELYSIIMLYQIPGMKLQINF